MKTMNIVATAASAGIAVVLSGALTPAHAQDDAQAVAVTAVTLATGGLAQVEGEMTGPGTSMRLAIERALVADVLRTLVITGPAPVRAIDLAAAERVGERSAAGRILSGDLSNPATVLSSLIGEEVALRGGTNQLSGRLLGFTFVTVEGGQDEGDRPALRISVVNEAGAVTYATFVTEAPLAIEGPAVEGRMAEVLPALADSVDDGRRELTVTLDESAVAGFRFVVPTTVWRPSYRATVNAEGDVALQGWATLENTTGLDWDGIRLSLAVGTPVSYQQDVYSPLRTTRANAPFSVGRTAQAPPVMQDMPMSESAALPNRPMRLRGSSAAGLMAAAPAPPPAPPAGLITGEPAVAGSATTIFSVAGDIDLDAGRTLTVPFLDASGGAERVAYADLRRRGAEPMDALELTFDPDATVPGGLIAVYDEGRFAGDAQFAGADGGERTILPFALSADVNLRMTENTRRTLTRAQLVDGTLRITREAERRIVLAVAASAPVDLVADMASSVSEVLAATQDAASIERLDPNLVRLRIRLEEGASRIDVTGVRPIIDQFRVGSIPSNVIEEVLSVGGAVDAATAERLRALSAALARLAQIDREIGSTEAEIADLRQALEADRLNLEALDAATPEGARARARIAGRAEEVDARVDRLRALRRDRLQAERTIRNP